jgi:hypothetical protein
MLLPMVELPAFELPVVELPVVEPVGFGPPVPVMSRFGILSFLLGDSGIPRLRACGIKPPVAESGVGKGNTSQAFGVPRKCCAKWTVTTNVLNFAGNILVRSGRRVAA